MIHRSTRLAGRIADRLILTFVFALMAGAFAPNAGAADEIYVTDYTANKILVYARTATGDVAPIRTVQTGLDHPHGLRADLGRGEMFVPNNLPSAQSPSVHVYDLNASYPGNDTPLRTITGAATLLNRPVGVAVDTVNQELYVTNDIVGASFITVYPLGASGNVAPIRTLQGALTGIEGPNGMIVDTARDELYVVNYRTADGGSISVFPRTATGNVAPVRTIQGTNTGFNKPQELALDLAHDELIVANSAFSTGLAGSVLVFSRTASGNVAPLRQIVGPSTQLCTPVGLFLDAVNNEIVAGNSRVTSNPCSESVTVYPRTANGDAAPTRKIGPGSLTGLIEPVSIYVRTAVDCSAASNGTPCDDGNACTQTDTCQSGVCTGSNPVVCTASDQCHDVGTCSTSTGLCSNPPKANGTSCNDGSLCTQTDTCQAGTCTGGNPVVCPAPQPCFLPGTCNPATGSCSAGGPVVCTASDQCHDAGVCDTGTGVCSNPPKTDGTPCNDDNACTQPDTCQAGVCTGTASVCTADEIFVSNYSSNKITVYARTASGDVVPIRTIQTGLDHPHTLGIDMQHQELFVPNNLASASSPAVHVYDLDASYPGADTPKRTITGPLTLLDRPAGIAVDTVHQELYVANDITSGAFVSVYPLGASGNVAPLRTLQGPLTGIDGPIGIAVDTVHDELSIVNYKTANGGSITTFARTAAGNVAPLRTIQGPGTGFVQPQGLVLDLAQNELIVANSAFATSASGSLLVFSRTATGNASPVRQLVGPSTGLCNPIGLTLDVVHNEIVAANSDFGTNACTQSITVHAKTANADTAPLRQIGPGPSSQLANPISVVVRTTPVNCATSPNGTICDDGNACTLSDTCQAGACVGGNPVVCNATDQCHDAGTCNTTTGICSNPPKADGTVCNDGDTCTQGETCQAGVCSGGSRICSPDEIFVSNYTSNKITVYVRTASGDVAPVRTIQTGLDHPHTLGVDLRHQELFVPNNLPSGQSPAVNVYDLDASFPGGDLPKRTITGALTLLDRPAGVAVDTVHNELWVGNDLDTGSYVSVYPLGASGDVAPLRTLQGALTGIGGPIGITVDTVHDEAYIVSYKTANGGSISAFARTASGNVPPLRTIQGPSTGLAQPQGIVIDAASDQLMVANSSFMTSGTSGGLLAFPRTASGDVTPSRQIAGPATGLCNPIGLTLDGRHDEIIAANSDFGTNTCVQSVTVFPRAASGDIAPLRQIGPGPTCQLSNPVSVAVRTITGNCATDPDGTPCDDGNFCTQSDSCQSGVCLGSNAIVCTALDQCHDAGVCDAATGVCSNPPKANGAACNDGSQCTSGDICNGGTCAGTAVVCNDGNVCTTDSCNPATGCVFSNNTNACDDGNACTTGDSCSGGSCQPGTAVVCNDNNACTTDSCSPATGCVYTNNTNPCNDGNACTSGDTCSGGACVGTAIACNDANPCTTDSCNPATGCVYTNNTAACSDGNACTTGDTCSGGTCQPGTTVVCNDNNVCTTDSCSPAVGCLFTINTNPCDDGNACTTGDTCSGGVCVGGPSRPAEVQGVTIGAHPTKVTWTVASGMVYDVASSKVSDLRAHGTSTATCLGNDRTSSVNDNRADPSPYDAYYYMVRAQGTCGTGSYGYTTSGQERLPTAACP